MENTLCKWETLSQKVTAREEAGAKREDIDKRQYVIEDVSEKSVRLSWVKATKLNLA